MLRNILFLLYLIEIIISFKRELPLLEIKNLENKISPFDYFILLFVKNNCENCEYIEEDLLLININNTNFTREYNKTLSIGKIKTTKESDYLELVKKYNINELPYVVAINNKFNTFFDITNYFFKDSFSEEEILYEVNK